MTGCEIFLIVLSSGGFFQYNFFNNETLKYYFNMLVTGTESFPAMHNTNGPKYKSFEKHKEILEIITDFGPNLVRRIKKALLPISNTRLLQP